MAPKGPGNSIKKRISESERKHRCQKEAALWHERPGWQPSFSFSHGVRQLQGPPRFDDLFTLKTGTCPLVKRILFEELNLVIGEFRSSFKSRNILPVAKDCEHEAIRVEIDTVEVAVMMCEERNGLVGAELRCFDPQTQRVVLRSVANNEEFFNIGGDPDLYEILDVESQMIVGSVELEGNLLFEIGRQRNVDLLTLPIPFGDKTSRC